MQLKNKLKKFRLDNKNWTRGKIMAENHMRDELIGYLLDQDN